MSALLFPRFQNVLVAALDGWMLMAPIFLLFFPVLTAFSFSTDDDDDDDVLIAVPVRSTDPLVAAAAAWRLAGKWC